MRLLNLAQPRRGRFIALVGAAVVLLASLILGLRGLERGALVPDERMWILQSQRMWPLFRDGEWDRPEWKDLDSGWGYVNPQVAKYAMGFTLELQRVRWEWNQGETPPKEVIVAARLSSVIFAAIGALAFYAIGLRVLGFLGAIVTALLLVASPLWIDASRRALTDIHAAALTLLAVAAFLPAWDRLLRPRRSPGLFAWTALSALFAGLAVGAKLNAACAPAALGLLVLGAFVRDLWARGPGWRSRAGGTFLAGILFGGVATGVFLLSNPYLHEDAWKRFAGIIEWWRTYCETQVALKERGVFGNAFRPMEQGMRSFVGKLVFPVRPVSALFLVPLAGALVVRWRSGSLTRAGLVGWLLLVPVIAFLDRSKSSIVHPWIVWFGLLGAILLGTFLTIADVRAERRTRAPSEAAIAVAVWGVAACFFVWRMTHFHTLRYYLPALPPLVLLAGGGLVRLRAELARTGGALSANLLDVAVLAGILSVFVSFPDFSRAQVGESGSEGPGAAFQALHGLGMVCAAAAIASTWRTAGRVDSTPREN